MKVKKLTVIFLAVCMITVMLSGCTSTAEGKVLYDAMMKSQNVKSCESDTKLTFRLDASGLNEQEQVAFEQIKAVLNNAEMSISMKQNVNADNAATMAKANANVSMGGIKMDMDIWLDMDMNSNPIKLKEIITVPAIITATDPSMAGKEYIVFDLGAMFNTPETEGQVSDVEISDTVKMMKEMQEKTLAFMSQYLIKFDPGFKFITDEGTRDIVTPERTVKAHIYQIKLDDKAAKKLVRYAVNDFVNSKEAMDFFTEYLKFIQKYTVSVMGAENSSVDFSDIMAEFENKKPEILAKFNAFMDSIENIQIIGEKGLVLEYAIDENGYVIGQSGSMDFVIDAAKFSSIIDDNTAEPAAVAGTETTESTATEVVTPDAAGTAPEAVENTAPAAQGVYSVGFDFNMIMYNLNKEFNIEMPVVTPENSIDYMEMLRSAIPAVEPAEAPADLPAEVPVEVPAE